MLYEKKQRNINLDLIRCVAVFSVISVHFFLNNGFYNTIVEGEKMYIMVMMRTFFMICVPLFFLLTGYLMNKKELSKKYYKGITKTLIVYVIVSIICILFNKYYLHKDITKKDALLSIFNFTGAKYSWYIEMYIGLFLLIPFINLIYNNLKDKKQKIALIITFVVLTVVPSFMNIYNFSSFEWWKNPASNLKYNALVPDWWVGIYPITYYFIGAYICEYKPKISVLKNIFILIGAVVLFSSFNYYRSHGAKFQSGIWVGWYSFENVIDSVLIFIFLLNLKLDKLPMFIKKIIELISKLSLSIYLISYVFDSIIYTKFNQRIPCVTDRLKYYPIVVFSVFVLSGIASYFVILLTDLINKFVFKMIDLIANSRLIKKDSIK